MFSNLINLTFVPAFGYWWYFNFTIWVI